MEGRPGWRSGGRKATCAAKGPGSCVRPARSQTPRLRGCSNTGDLEPMFSKSFHFVIRKRKIVIKKRSAWVSFLMFLTA